MSTYTDYGYNNLLSVSGNSAISSNTSETTTANASSSTINTSNVDSAIDSGTISIDKTTINKLLVGQYIKSSNYVTGVSGWIIDGSGNVEFSSGTFRGNIAAATGTIGGWTIGANELYATTTGVLKTAATVGVGSNGVILDKDGLRVYDSVLGQVVNLPSNGDVPSFSSGTINETTFEISTNAVLRTSSTVGDGSANSAGVLINNSGIYGCGANQALADANVKILTTGIASFKGDVTATSGYFGGTTNGVQINSAGLEIIGSGYVATGTTGSRVVIAKDLSGGYTDGILAYNSANTLIYRMAIGGGLPYLTMNGSYNAQFLGTDTADTGDNIKITTAGKGHALNIETSGTESERSTKASLNIGNTAVYGSAIKITKGANTQGSAIDIVTNNLRKDDMTFTGNTWTAASQGARITNEHYLQFPAYHHCSDFDEMLSANTDLASTNIAKCYWTGGGTSGTQTLVTNATPDISTYIVLSTTAASTKSSTMTFGRYLNNNNQLCVEMRAKMSSLTNTTMKFGLYYNSTNYAWFVFDSAVSATKLYFATHNSSYNNSVDLGQSMDDDSWFILRMTSYASGNYRLGGNFGGSDCDFAPGTQYSASSPIKPYVYIDNKTSSDEKLLYIDYIKIWCGRSFNQSPT